MKKMLFLLKIQAVCLFLLFVGAGMTSADEGMKTTQNFYKVSLASVYDGDTFKVNLSCRYGIFCKKMGVRVKGIDAPEIRTKDPCEKEMAKKAKAFTKEILKSGSIILRNCEKDKYFRLLCDVSVRDPNNPAKKAEKSLAEVLLAQKLAVAYDGGTKKSINWCAITESKA